MDDKPALIRVIESLKLNLSSAQIDRLIDYLALMSKWNKVHNLTARTGNFPAVPYHLLDSLSVRPHLRGYAIADVGSGAGLPGVPLAIACPEKRFSLLERNGKKARFLTQVKIDLGLDNLAVLHDDVMNVSGETFDAIVCRAFGPLKRIIGKSHHLLDAGGVIIAMKSRVPASEMAQIVYPFRLLDACSMDIPGIHGERSPIILEKMK